MTHALEWLFAQPWQLIVLLCIVAFMWALAVLAWLYRRWYNRPMPNVCRVCGGLGAISTLAQMSKTCTACAGTGVPRK